MPLKIKITPREPLKCTLFRKTLQNRVSRQRSLSDATARNRKAKLQRSRESSPTNQPSESSSFSFVPKCVKFDDKCKRHDGLRPASRVFDSLVWQYFMSSTCFSLPPIMCHADLDRHFRGCSLAFLSEVKALLRDLIDRLQLSLTMHVPVLASGGGFGGRLTFDKHMGSLRILAVMVNDFVEHKKLMRDDNSCASNSSDTVDSDEFAAFDETNITEFDFDSDFDFDDALTSST